MTSRRKNGKNIKGHFKSLPESFQRIFRVACRYLFPGLEDWPFKIFAKTWPLLIPLLIPSKELGLINPAASPIKKMLSFPQQKLRKEEGRKTWQLSVFNGVPKQNPICRSFCFWRSKRSRQFWAGYTRIFVFDLPNSGYM